MLLWSAVCGSCRSAQQPQHPAALSPSLSLNLLTVTQSGLRTLNPNPKHPAARARCRRWEVYLCTTAEREYAWEAWRLLDPQASIFPHNQLSWRMLCVSHPQKKDLLNVLRKKEFDAAVATAAAQDPPQSYVPTKASDLQLVTDKGESRAAVLQRSSQQQQPHA